MRAIGKHLFVLTTLVLATLTGAVAAAASPGPGTFTRVTVPSSTSFTFNYNGAKPHDQNTFIVSGQTSSDVNQVDIDCVFSRPDNGYQIDTYATAVPVSGGSFSTVAVYPQAGSAPCRLLAVPTGVTPGADYHGSYTGPILYTHALIKIVNGGGHLTEYELLSERGDAVAILTDAGNCGVADISTVTRPEMIATLPEGLQCGFGIPSANVTPSGTPTASAIKVDGHVAYLPGAVGTYLIGGLHLSVTQPALTISDARAANGDEHLVERGLVMTCVAQSPANPNTYPPTGTSCHSLKSTGVNFVRVIDVIRGSHQVRLRDSFGWTSGGSHSVSLQYQGEVAARPTGAPGFAFPGHTSFAAVSPGQVVTGLGSRAGSLFVRSDRYAAPDDLMTDTLGFTWSKAPSSIRFDGGANKVFALTYGLSVPSGGKAYLGFAYSERLLTTDTQSLARAAVAEMMNAPTISAPKNGAVITGKSTTVKGAVTAGANGLPTKVTVNGHAAKLTKVSATKATYAVTFSAAFGKHVLKATAYDNAGNSQSRSITVRNKS